MLKMARNDKKNVFAWASIGENGRATGGKKGDQTGKEVKVGNYYNFGQDRVARCISNTRGRLIGRIAKKLAQNDNIGYNQSDRGSLYAYWKKKKWCFTDENIADMPKCNCDCSSFYATVINLAFQSTKVPCFSTGTMSVYLEPSDFKIMRINDVKSWHKGDAVFKACKHVIINV